jgi:hypothetical protein
MGKQKGKEIQTKVIDDLLNKIIAENFSNLRRYSPKFRCVLEHQKGNIRKETPSNIV